MNYTIHEMAHLLGVAPHTLRYYEKIGIISPWTDKTNGYRYYSVVDTRRFNLCRALRASGFSLEDCRMLLSDPQGEESTALLQKQAEELSRKAVLCELTAQRLQKMERNFQDSAERVGKVTITELPDAWRLTLAKGELPIKNPLLEKEKQRWLECLPVVQWVSYIPHETLVHFGEGQMVYEPGLMIPAQEAEMLGLDKTPGAEFVPGGKYASTIWRQTGRGPFSWGSLKSLLDWLCQKKITCFEEGYSMIFSSRVNLDGEVENFHFQGVRLSPKNGRDNVQGV